MEGEGRHAPTGLIEISRQLAQAARLLRRHAEAEGAEARPADSGADPPPESDSAWVRAILDLRTLRRDWLGFDASDAALAMLLALYAARLERRSLHQNALAVAAQVPGTTALRIIRHHLARGTFRSAPDPDDKRLALITLSDGAEAQLRAYLAAAAARGVPLLV